MTLQKRATPPAGRHEHQSINLTDWKFPMDETKKAQSLSVIRMAAEQKRIRPCPTFTELLFNQLRFQSWRYRILEGIILLTAMALALTLHKRQTDRIETLAACSVFLVFAGNIFLGHVASLFSWHMAELEQTLYLNLKQMVCIRMLEAGIADLVILTLFLIITGSKQPSEIGTSLIYMLAPFLWSDTLYLHMLTNLRNISQGFRSLAFGLLSGTLALFPILWESVYQPKYLVIWQILTLTGLALLIAEVYGLLGKIENGGDICLN